MREPGTADRDGLAPPLHELPAERRRLAHRQLPLEDGAHRELESVPGAGNAQAR